jgi:hypothetical protein
MIIDPDELWLCHYSCMSWSDPDRWIGYFRTVEGILGARITHLDQNDPVRRRVKPGEFAELAEYVVSMGERENSRWLHGKMASVRLSFSVQHNRDFRVPGFPNSVSWYFPARFVDNASGLDAVRSLFECGDTWLSPFYAYSDIKAQIASKKKEWAVDLRAELLGVFWLTYFNSRYVEFIGKDKFKELPGISVKFDGGATLDLGESPWSVPDGLRAQAQAKLCPKLFVESNEVLRKRPGEYALTYEQLCCPSQEVHQGNSGDGFKG